MDLVAVEVQTRLMFYLASAVRRNFHHVACSQNNKAGKSHKGCCGEELECVTVDTADLCMKKSN